ncbi:MAG: hypothetical protein JXA17_08675 [Dehalococcoidales bacterium]|nr:hypothetical protein [Dehalococcoidales bacterium]
MKLKRKRGGQPGNQNARKHGFYSPYMTRPEIRRFQKILNKNGASPRAIAIGIKLSSALRYDPANRRVLREASSLLYNYVYANCPLDRKDRVELRRYIRCVIKAIRDKFAGTIEADSPENRLKLTERTEAASSKSIKK